MQQTILHSLQGSRRLSAAFAVAFMLAATLPTTWASWTNTTINTSTGGATILYTDTANWSGGSINNVITNNNANFSQFISFDAVNTTLNGTLYITKAQTLSTVDSPLQLQGSGGNGTNRTLTLGGDIVADIPLGNYRNFLIIGNRNTNANKLKVDLGGASRTISTIGYSDDGQGQGGVQIINGISGAGGTYGLTKNGPGDLYLDGASTFTGTLDVQRGRIFVGDQGTLATNNIQVGNFGILQSTNRTRSFSFTPGATGPTANAGNAIVTPRIPATATVTMKGGAFASESVANSGTTPEQQTVGTMVLSAGTSQVYARYNNAGGAVDSVLNITTLTRNPGTAVYFAGGTRDDSGTVGFDFYGNIGNGATNGEGRVVIGNYASLGLYGSGDKIIPWAIIANPGANSNRTTGFATYDTTVTNGVPNGIRAVASTAQADFSGTTIATNLKLTANAPISGATDVNSLWVDGGRTISGTGTLKIASGGVLSHAGNATFNSTVTLDFNGQEAIFHANMYQASFTVNGPITNTGGNGVTVAAGYGGAFTFGSTSNTYTGLTSITKGRAILGNVAGIPAASPVRIDQGAELDLANNAGGTVNLASISGTGMIVGRDYDNFPPTGSVTLKVGATGLSSTFDGQYLNGQGVATANLVKEGAGTLTLNGINSYNGTTTINGGTILANGPLVAARTVSGTDTATFQLNIADTSGLQVGQTIEFASGSGTNWHAGAYVVTDIVPNMAVMYYSPYNSHAAYTVNFLAGSATGRSAVVINDTGRLAGTGGVYGPVTVNAGGTLGGTLTVANSVTASSASTSNLATVAPGNSIGTLTVGDMTFGNNSQLLIELGYGTGDQLIVLGNLNVNGTGTILNLTGGYSSSPIVTFASASDYTFDTVRYNGVDYNWAAAQVYGVFGGGLYNLQVRSNGLYLIPEPASVTLLALAGALLFRRRRYAEMAVANRGAAMLLGLAVVVVAMLAPSKAMAYTMSYTGTANYDQIYLDVTFENQTAGTVMNAVNGSVTGSPFTANNLLGNIDTTVNNSTNGEWGSGTLAIVNTAVLGTGKAMQLSGDYVSPNYRTPRVRLLPTATITAAAAAGQKVAATYLLGENNFQNSSAAYGARVVNSLGQDLLQIQLDRFNAFTTVYYGASQMVNFPRLEANETRNERILLNLDNGTFQYTVVRGGSMSGTFQTAWLPFLTTATAWNAANLSFGIGGGEFGVYVYDIDNIQMGVIPEPASLSLFALAGAALLRRRRR